ncbi:MAG TPA: hypothetical protein VLS89_18705 [Candidatus Nanopelagicales bacterium]|nr:hypothetical protein [Candidatus Nanopelagicales bacterium]
MSPFVRRPRRRAGWRFVRRLFRFVLSVLRIFLVVLAAALGVGMPPPPPPPPQATEQHDQDGEELDKT